MSELSATLLLRPILAEVKADFCYSIVNEEKFVVSLGEAIRHAVRWRSYWSAINLLLTLPPYSVLTAKLKTFLGLSRN
jgi:hypothetical protein